LILIKKIKKIKNFYVFKKKKKKKNKNFFFKKKKKKKKKYIYIYIYIFIKEVINFDLYIFKIIILINKGTFFTISWFYDRKWYFIFRFWSCSKSY